ncbi:hypothetical protein GCM10017691_38020 [Pseudonocardia petroleophila]|uniref:Flp pilus-assembly TadE/G-like n=1 Tax=Pseudonocardia petroleophila TaxID=37331 RepID=A0A7G7MCE3_9PSEU|nr:hypothetical protein [Pseudonocardia petroleophila]QNG50454.1 hypothetical protein H6H00_19715 [Pseudonocardia petroleophila]
MTGDEQGGGAVSAPMAIAVLALFAVIGLGIDGVRAAQGLARADALAEEAARAAGQILDVAELQRGRVVIDDGAAVNAAVAYLHQSDADGTASIIGDRVRVQVRISQPTVLLGLVGRTEIVSTGSAEALLFTTVPAEGTP